MVHLARRGHDDELIRLAIQHYPHGQVGGSKLAGRNAERRIEGLLREAEKIRARGGRSGEAPAWYGELLTTKGGAPRDCLANGCLILRKDAAFVGRVFFDEHRGAVVCWDLPWCPGEDRRSWTGTDDIRFAEWCQVRGVPLKSGTCAEAVTAVADGNRMHPVREYLDGLEWDGVPRLDTWLATYAGVTAGDATYVSEVGRRWMISAVARVFRPGCKADTALILEGGQGAGKSSLLRALVPSPEWFADEIADLGSKDSAQDLSGKWVIELAELSALRRGEVERVKAFMTRAVDHYRPSYGRRSQDFPRQCVFAGTTNADAYLADETGNRRFWPVKVGAIDLVALRRDRDQLWAETVHAYEKGEKWWLDREVEKLAAEEQADRQVTDPWADTVLGWAERLKAEELVTIRGALLVVLDLPVERHDQANSNRVARILKGAGWERYKAGPAGGRFWAYRRPR